MTCSHVLDLVEAVAARDLAVDEEMRAHIETCPRCAGALATARRVEAALAARAAPEAPARFTPMVLQRIGREKWHTEQQVDRFFNAAVAAALVLVVGGIAALLNLGGVLGTAAGTLSLLSSVSGQVARDAAPALNTYIAAAGLLVTALGMWWWAERTLST